MNFKFLPNKLIYEALYLEALINEVAVEQLGFIRSLWLLNQRLITRFY